MLRLSLQLRFRELPAAAAPTTPPRAIVQFPLTCSVSCPEKARFPLASTSKLLSWTKVGAPAEPREQAVERLRAPPAMSVEQLVSLLEDLRDDGSASFTKAHTPL
jgi:hypothetical protein